MATFFKTFLIVGVGSVLVMMAVESESGQRLVTRIGGPVEQLWGERHVPAAPVAVRTLAPPGPVEKVPEPVLVLPTRTRRCSVGPGGYS